MVRTAYGSELLQIPALANANFFIAGDNTALFWKKCKSGLTFWTEEIYLESFQDWVPLSDGMKLGIYEMKIDKLSWLIKQIIIQNH